jgi:hypothetical protein
MSYIDVSATNDVEFYLYALAIKNTNITSSQTKKIGTKTITWQKHNDGVLIRSGDKKFFFPYAIEYVSEYMIDFLEARFNKNWIFASETERAKNKANFDKRFEAGRKIVTEKEEDKQTTEHINLIASALKKNPAVISVAFKEHPEVLKNILEAILPSILEGILPAILRTELQDLRKELTSSLNIKLVETIRAMIQ